MSGTVSHTDIIWSQIQRSFEAGRLAHAWMIVGNSRGNARRFAHQMAAMVLSAGQDEKGRARVAHLVEEHTHPDLSVVEPQSKSRRITTDEIREVNLTLHTTSYEGGWKVAVIQNADRLMTNAANAFLKTLEEPPPNTLILLLTESPQAMLNTVVSRCQRLILSEDLADQGDPVWSGRLADFLAKGWPADAGDSLVLVAGITGILAEQEAESSKLIKGEDDEMVTRDEQEARISSLQIETRSDIMEYMIEWYRDVLVQCYATDAAVLHHPRKQAETQQEARRLSSAGAQQCLERLWEIQVALERNLPVDRALLNGLRPVPKSVAVPSA